MAQYLNMAGVEALWAKIKGTFALKSHSHSNYVTTDTAQTITGSKTFNNGDQSPITLVRSSSDFVSVRFDGSSGILGYLGFMGVDQPMYRRVSDNVYLNLLHSGNSSVSKSGETLTVTINGVSKTLTNTNTTYSTATSGALGLVKIGYTANGKNYPVQLSNGQMYVNVPWTDTNSTYNFSGISFSSGNSNTAEHDCNSITSNGHWYYSSNGPATSLGAQSTDGALYSQAYNSSWVGQIAQDYRNGNLFTRGKNNGTWTAWKAVSYNGHTHSYLSLNGGTVNGSITATAFYQSSDERLKTFHDPIKVDLEKLKTLRKNYFKFNDKDKLEIGVSAQEVQEIYPELVTADEEGYLSVAYDKLSVIALKAIDELDNKYQKEINDLNNQLSTIKNILKEKGIL